MIALKTRKIVFIPSNAAAADYDDETMLYFVRTFFINNNDDRGHFGVKSIYFGEGHEEDTVRVIIIIIILNINEKLAIK